MLIDRFLTRDPAEIFVERSRLVILTEHSAENNWASCRHPRQLSQIVWGQESDTLQHKPVDFSTLLQRS